MKAKDFDRKFDENKEEIIEYLDLDTARRPGLEPKRVNVDFPEWMVAKLDKEAKRLNISRQAVIKAWIGQRLDAQNSKVLS
ncbi:CopG family transcriptional regulator [Candidatus Acetothermia bacterium]|nr:CopG family transcriptional regulator [Candidatus Acetothermia bacterium]MBI3642616.1 CopG family transcriptional regulator [Candidatus Acetothermia bacterium]